jgi:hypothetical protein
MQSLHHIMAMTGRRQQVGHRHQSSTEIRRTVLIRESSILCYCQCPSILRILSSTSTHECWRYFFPLQEALKAGMNQTRTCPCRDGCSSTQAGVLLQQTSAMTKQGRYIVCIDVGRSLGACDIYMRMLMACVCPVPTTNSDQTRVDTLQLRARFTARLWHPTES